jgi:hypothetical protein
VSKKNPNKKPIGERIKGSKFGVFIRDKVKPVAGDILEIAGDITGIQALETVGAYLNGQKHKSDEHNAIALEFEKLRLNFELEMTRLDMQTELEFYKAEVSDRDSARVREAAFLNATGKRDWLMGAVVIVGLSLTVGVVLSLIFVVIPIENQRLADMTFGSVLSIGTSIFAYYVGSSRGSAMKDKLLQANRIFLAGDTDNAGQQAMTKLWTELRDRTYLLKWTEAKDANEAFLKNCAQ